MNRPLYPTFTIALLCCLFLSTTYGQKVYTSGQFIIKYQIGKTEDADSNKYNEIKNGTLNSHFNNQITHVVFNDSLLAMVNMDSLGNIKSRVVSNYNSYQKLWIRPENGTIYHSRMGIKADHLAKNILNGGESFERSSNKIIKKERKKEKLDEWNVVTVATYSTRDYSTTRDFSFTSDIETPNMKFVRPKATNVIDSNIIVRKRRFYERKKVWIDKGIVNFTSEIKNPEWLDESAEGIPNISEYKYNPENDPFAKKKVINYNFAKIPNGSTETESAIELMNSGRLSPLYYNSFNDGGTMDRLSIIVNTKEKKEDVNPAESKMKALFDLNLISQKDVDYLKNVFRDNKEWNQGRRQDFCRLYFLNQELKKLTFRTNIIDNLIVYGCKFNPKNGEDKQFLSGLINIGEMLGTERRIFPTTYPKSIPANPPNVIDEIKNVIEPILISQNIDYKIISIPNDNKLTIVSEEVNYEIDFSDALSDVEKKNENLIRINKDLVQKWLDPLKQLAADQYLEFAYGTHDWISVLLRYVKESDYNEFVLKCPELKLVDHTLYVIAIPKKEFWTLSIIIDVGIHHSEKKSEDIQYSFSSIHSVVEAGTDYVTKNQKEAFLNHIKKYKKEYQLDNDAYNDIEKDLHKELITDVYSFLGKIPNVKMSLPSFIGGYPKINSKKNDFKDVFPTIDEFIKGDFKATKLKVDPLSKFILEMEYNGNKVGVTKSVNSNLHSLLKFLNSHLKANGHEIYKTNYFLSKNYEYMYLKDDQRKELENIFNFKFSKVD